MKRRRILLPIIVLLVSVAFIAIGIFRNEVAVVLKNAVMICLECIGIG